MQKHSFRYPMYVYKYFWINLRKSWEIDIESCKPLEVGLNRLKEDFYFVKFLKWCHFGVIFNFSSVFFFFLTKKKFFKKIFCQWHGFQNIFQAYSGDIIWLYSGQTPIPLIYCSLRINSPISDIVKWQGINYPDIASDACYQGRTSKLDFLEGTVSC